MRSYRCEAKTAGGFVQQLAVCYIGRKYYHYVMGHIPSEKDPRETDKRILEKYDIAVSKHVNYKRRKAGLASVQYLRFDRTFIIVATKGHHEFKAAEIASLRNAKLEPIQFKFADSHGELQVPAAYSIGVSNEHPSVRIARSTFAELKVYFEAIATKRTLAQMFAEFSALPYEPYSPVLDQLFELLRAVNRKREQAGLLPLKGRPIRTRRKIFLPFEDVPEGRSLHPNLGGEPVPLVDS